jgi:hypothetical protein
MTLFEILNKKLIGKKIYIRKSNDGDFYLFDESVESEKIEGTIIDTNINNDKLEICVFISVNFGIGHTTVCLVIGLDQNLIFVKKSNTKKNKN